MPPEANNSEVYNSLIEPKSLTVPRKSPTLPCIRLSLTALLVCLGGAFHFGYNLVLTNPAQKAFLSFLNESWTQTHREPLSSDKAEAIWSIIVSLLYWGMVIGSLLIGVLSEKYGRKGGFFISNCLQSLAIGLAVYSYVQTDYLIYSVSRLMLGIGQALALGIGPMFISECSPKSCRGVISLSTGLTVQISIVIGAIVGMPQVWGTVSKWWIIYAVELGILLTTTVFSLFMHESPGFLVSRGNHKRALKSVRVYHNLSADEAQLVVDELQSASLDAPKPLSIFTVSSDPLAVRGIKLGASVMAAVVLSGVVVINAFAVEILINTGLDIQTASYANVGISMMTVLGAIASSFVVDRYGRRPLVIWTNLALAAINVAIFAFMIGFEKTKNPILGWSLVTVISLFSFFFSVGPGPVSFFITAELVPQHARGAAQTYINLVMSIGRSILLAVFLPFKNWIGGPFAYISLFVLPLILIPIYLHYTLPETKNKSIGEVQRLMVEKKTTEESVLDEL